MTARDERTDEQPTTGKGLRASLEAANAKIRELEETYDADVTALKDAAMESAFRELGLDRSSGIGRAAATLFEGEPYELRAFVESEFEYTPSPPQHPQAAAIRLGNAALDQVGNVATTVQPESQAERLAKARAQGDFETEGAIMSAQMVEMMNRQRRGL